MHPLSPSGTPSPSSTPAWLTLKHTRMAHIPFTLKREAGVEKMNQRRATCSALKAEVALASWWRLGKMFQNLSVSSPAPVTMVLPSGLIARQRTRQVWPVRVAIFSMCGYFQRLISLWEQPWVETISLSVLLNMRLQTCDPTSTVFSVAPVSVFRKRMLRSAVPPPDTSSPCWCGDQAMALTAATWSLKRRTGSGEWLFQTSSLLSLPPEHSCCSSGDHLSPQISCLCPWRRATKGAAARRSRCRMALSREPVESREELQEMAPTRLLCPGSTRTRFIFATSQIWTSPLLVPSENSGPLADQHTAVAESEMPRSHSLVTLELAAFQRQTLEARPTARKFCVDQSMRLRQQSSWRAGASSTLQGSRLILRRFWLPSDTSSANSSPLPFPRLDSSSAGCERWEQRSMLPFSKVDISFSLPLPPSRMNLRQMSETQLVAASRVFSSAERAVSWRSRESRLSSLRLGMQRSVSAQLSPSSSSAMLLHSTAGRKECSLPGEPMSDPDEQMVVAELVELRFSRLSEARSGSRSGALQGLCEGGVRWLWMVAMQTIFGRCLIKQQNQNKSYTMPAQQNQQSRPVLGCCPPGYASAWACAKSQGSLIRWGGSPALLDPGGDDLVLVAEAVGTVCVDGVVQQIEDVVLVVALGWHRPHFYQLLLQRIVRFSQPFYFLLLFHVVLERVFLAVLVVLPASHGLRLGLPVLPLLRLRGESGFVEVDGGGGFVVAGPALHLDHPGLCALLREAAGEHGAADEGGAPGAGQGGGGD